MKKLFLVASIMMISICSMNPAKAQVNLSINIGSQPLWGPTGYNHVEYYYLPDIDVYYYVPSGQYVYLNNGRWIWTDALPVRYRNFDLYRAYKVVINTRRPYLQHDQHIKTYAKYKNYSGQQAIIRDSHDRSYNVVKGHQNYNGNKNNSISRPQPRPQNNNNNSLRPDRGAGNENHSGRPQGNHKPQRN